MSLSLSCPHLAAAPLRPATTTSNGGTGAKKLTASSPPWGDWVSRSEHLPPCFYYHSQPSSPSLIRNHRLAVETQRAMTPAFYRKRVERILGVFMCCYRPRRGYWCARGGHDLGAADEVLFWKGAGRCGRLKHHRVFFSTVLTEPLNMFVGWRGESGLAYHCTIDQFSIEEQYWFK